MIAHSLPNLGCLDAPSRIGRLSRVEAITESVLSRLNSTRLCNNTSIQCASGFSPVLITVRLVS